MSENESHEARVVIESPVHGPAIVAELRRLRAREQEILEAWGGDDHEARELRFALFDIENEANACGNAKLAEMAQRARIDTGKRSHAQLKDLIRAIAIVVGDKQEIPLKSFGETMVDLKRAYEPFAERKP